VARLVLVGLPGAGKSTIARSLAETWRVDVVDTDDVVATLVGVPVAAFLREHGEAAFRARELEALESALEGDVIVATGAGIVTTNDGRTLLKRECTIWLDADDETLLFRVGVGDRPLLGEDHREGLKELRADREGYYREVARARVDTAGDVDGVLARVIERSISVIS
jgi:shikimate kinase